MPSPARKHTRTASYQGNVVASLHELCVADRAAVLPLISNVLIPNMLLVLSCSPLKAQRTRAHGASERKGARHRSVLVVKRTPHSPTGPKRRSSVCNTLPAASRPSSKSCTEAALPWRVTSWGHEVPRFQLTRRNRFDRTHPRKGGCSKRPKLTRESDNRRPNLLKKQFKLAE